MKKMISFFVLIIFFVFNKNIILYAQSDVFAEYGIENEQNTKDGTIDEMINSIEDEEINEMLDEFFSYDISFKAMLSELISGKIPFNFDTVWELVKQVFVSEINENKESLIAVFLLCVMAALFTNFTKVLESGNVADIGFYILYLLLTAILLKSFQITYGIASDVLMHMTEFMKVLLPTFFVTVVAAGGAHTALVYYEFILTAIYIVEVILQKIVLPLCNVYVIINIINQISREDLFSKMTQLLYQIILWIIKWMFAIVMGINFVHSIITPAVDEFKGSMFNRAITSVPGVGNTLGGMSDVVIGSGVLIKNSVGAAILILLVMLTITPIVKIFICMFLYRLTAAVIQPISDKRMILCVETTAKASQLLLKCVVTTMSLLFLTMAVVTVATG